jgi:G3E family GTPase
MPLSVSVAALKTPVTIFTGFLGSGKTTIISHLINELQSLDKQVVFIKNEIGSEDIDSKLLRGQNIETKELLNGCICCTLVGPFMSAIDEIIDTFHPDRIIIEASGAADPSAIALMVSSHPRLSRDGVISIVDVVNFKGYSDLSQTSRNQTQFTDLIVFNKVELVDLDQKQRVVGYVRELNTHSPIIEAPQGKLPPEVVFGISTTELTQLLETTHQSEHQHHLDTDHLSTLTLELPTELALETLKQWLSTLPASVFRVKGIYHSESDGDWLINKVGTRVDITSLAELSAPVPSSKLVLIGFALEQLETSLSHQLATLSTHKPNSSSDNAPSSKPVVSSM